MKILLLLTLLINTAYAQHFLTINRNESGFANSQFDADSKDKACEKLLKVVSKRKWLQGEFNSIQDGSECSRFKVVDLEVTEELEYYHPSNFSIVYEDKTAQMVQEQADKKTDKDERKALKALRNALDDTTPVAEWRANVIKILKRILKDMKED